MVRALLTRGMLAGVIAGLFACAFAWIFGEPQVDLALGFEQHMHAAAGGVPEPALVSTAVQGTAGLLTGLLVWPRPRPHLLSRICLCLWAGRPLKPTPYSSDGRCFRVCGASFRKSSIQRTRPRSVSGTQLRDGRRFASRWLRCP